jgi:MtaA/CmuA family methyltransferase
LPVCRRPYIQSPSDMKKLKLFDPLHSTRILDRIHAVERYHHEAGRQYSILGWVEGAFAEAADLRGVSEIMMDLYDAPFFVEELLSMCCLQGIACAKEQIKAGADFIGIGDAVASLVSPSIYRDIILPHEKKLIEEIHRAGASAKLHICGNISHILNDIWQSDADIIDIDSMVDFKAAVDCFKDHRPCANGNFDPVAILYMGNPGSVRQSVRNCLAVADGKTFISAGCEVPPYTPYENLEAVHDELLTGDAK